MLTIGGIVVWLLTLVYVLLAVSQSQDTDASLLATQLLPPVIIGIGLGFLLLGLGAHLDDKSK